MNLVSRTTCFAVALFIFGLAPQASADDAVIEKLVGTWKYTSGEKNGQKLDADHFSGQSIEITPERITLNGEATFGLEYELSTDKKPMKIEMKIVEGPFGVGEGTVGIIEVDGDKLKICYSAMGGDAPTEFAAGDGTNRHLFSLARDTKPIDAAKIVGTWNYTSGMKDGAKLAADHFAGQTVTITEETFTLQAGEKFVMKYDLDAAKDPASIQFTMTESPFGAGAKANGIVRLKDGVLSVCYSPEGGAAPEKFDAADGSGHFLFNLKKAEQ